MGMVKMHREAYAMAPQPPHRQKYEAGARKMKAMMSSKDALSFASFYQPDKDESIIEGLPFRVRPLTCSDRQQSDDVRNTGSPAFKRVGI